MKCRFCGAELMPGTSFCVKCGNNNAEEVAQADKAVQVDEAAQADKVASEEVSPDERVKVRSKRKVPKALLAVLILVIVIILVLIPFTVAMMTPIEPEASAESGVYDECLTISFSASRIIPFGNEPEMYLSVDGSGYELYEGDEFYLNQVGIYSYDIYTVNGVGVVSEEKHYEYDMNVPKPAELSVSVSPGAYEDYQDVQIISDDDSVVYFTVDGTDPDISSEVYDASIIHLDNGKTTIKAFAINSAGTIGDIYQWDYELNLPVPTAVTYSVEGGIYYNAFELELRSDDDATIYYTLDGSEPTSQSKVYSAPITLEDGIYTVKAIAVNNYNMQSAISSSNYSITLQKFGKYQRSAVTDMYYGIIGDSGTLVAYDSKMKEAQRYGVNNAVSVYSDGSSIYYLASNALYKLTAAGSSTKLVNMYIDNFVIADNLIYIESSNLLYSMELDGSSLTKFDGIESCSIMGCWDNAIYFNNDNSVFKISSRGSAPEEIIAVDSASIVLAGNKVYYIDADSGLSCMNMDGGSNSKLISAESEYYNLDPEYELINTTDKSQTVTTTCVDLYACNNTVYVLKQTDSVYREYHLITGSTDVTTSTSYRWYAVNTESGNVSDTNISTRVITVFDDAIIDGNENETRVIQ